MTDFEDFLQVNHPIGNKMTFLAGPKAHRQAGNLWAMLLQDMPLC